MAVQWINAIVTALGICTVAIGVVEFLGGKELNKRIRGELESWWIRLSYLKWPGLGLAEAKFSLRVFERVAGSTFSIRRLLAIVVVMGTLAWWTKSLWGVGWTHFYHLLERYSADEAPSYEMEGFRSVLFGVLFVQAFVSLWLADKLLRWPISWFEGKKRSTALFFGVILATTAFSFGLAFALSASVASIVATTEPFRYDYPIILDFQKWLGQQEGSTQILMLHVAHMADFLAFIRVGLFALFTLSVIAGWLLKLLTLVVLRLTESEKGALTTFSAGITAVAAGIKWWLKGGP